MDDPSGEMSSVQAGHAARRWRHLVGAGVAILLVSSFAGFAFAHESPLRHHEIPAGNPAAPPTRDPIGINLDDHPQADFVASDPAAQDELAEFESGWIRVAAWDSDGSALRGNVPARFLVSSTNGDVSEVVDLDLQAVGYWISSVGFVPKDVFESETFSLDEYVHERLPHDSEAADEVLESIEEAGGLRETQVVDG